MEILATRRLLRASVEVGLGLWVAATSACVTDKVLSIDRGSIAARDSGAAPVDARAAVVDPAPPPPTTEARSDGGATMDPPAEPPAVAAGPCDLTGAWLVTQHLMSTALGVKQSGLQWYYYDIKQSAGDLTVVKGLACGGRAMPEDPLGALVTYEAAYPRILSNNPHAGRKARVEQVGEQCQVSWTRTTTVIGATVSYYIDSARPLPTKEQEAAGDTPGWEDWDQDGLPGVTLTISGIVNGKRYSSLRLPNDWGGSFPPGATNFEIPALDAEEETAAYGVTTEILYGMSTPLSNPDLHFVQFAKLKAGQVQGDDTAICAAIRELAPTLAPRANSPLQ